VFAAASPFPSTALEETLWSGKGRHCKGCGGPAQLAPSKQSRSPARADSPVQVWQLWQTASAQQMHGHSQQPSAAVQTHHNPGLGQTMPAPSCPPCLACRRPLAAQRSRLSHTTPGRKVALPFPPLITCQGRVEPCPKSAPCASNALGHTRSGPSQLQPAVLRLARPPSASQCIPPLARGSHS